MLFLHRDRGIDKISINECKIDLHSIDGITVLHSIAGKSAMDYLIHTPSQLGQALRARRKSLGANQSDAGDRAGLTQNTVSKLELNPAPSTIESLLRLISALDLELVLRPKQDSKSRPPPPAVDEEPEW